MVRRTKKRGPPKARGSPIQVVPPPRRESPRRTGTSVQEERDVKTKDTTIDASAAIAFEEHKARMISKNDRFLPTSPQPGNEKEIVHSQVSPIDKSLESQVNNEPAVNDPVEKLHTPTANNELLVNDQSLGDSQSNNDVASDSVVPELLADHDENHPQSPLTASKPPPSSTATNSKTSMADSSRLPNDAGKKANTTDDSSSSDESSSSDDYDDGARPAPPKPRGKVLAFQSRFGQGKQVRLGAPSANKTSEESSDSSIDRKDSAHSATTTGRGKILAGKKLSRVLPTAKNRSTKSVPRDVGQCVYFDVFSTYAHQKLPNAEEFDEIKAAVKSVITNVTSQRSGSTNFMSQLNSEVTTSLKPS